jgi:hypothetical protein
MEKELQKLDTAGRRWEERLETRICKDEGRYEY